MTVPDQNICLTSNTHSISNRNSYSRVLLGCGRDFHKRCAYKIPNNCTRDRARRLSAMNSTSQFNNTPSMRSLSIASDISTEVSNTRLVSESRESLSHSVTQSVAQPVTQSITESVIQSVNQSVTELVTQSNSQAVNYAVTQSVTRHTYNQSPVG